MKEKRCIKFLKDKRFERPTTRDNMIRKISEAIRSLGAEEILRATNCFQNRVDACIAENSGHFEHLLV